MNIEPPQRQDNIISLTGNSSRPSSISGRSTLTEDQTRHAANQPQAARFPDYIYACTPSRSQRYRLNRFIKDTEPRHTIQPSSISFPNEGSLPSARWKQHIHPEGLPYFVLSCSDASPVHKIVTEEWMYDHKISTLILGLIEEIQDAISKPGVFIWPRSYLFLELQQEQGKLVENDGHARCGYYFVCDPARCIYWHALVVLEPPLSRFLHSVWGHLSGHLTKLCLETEYWAHLSHFPSLHRNTPEIVDCVDDAIRTVQTSVIHAPYASSATFTYEELQKISELMTTRNDDVLRWHIGLSMMRFAQDKLRNYHGAWNTRLYRSQSVVEVEHKPCSLFVDIISPFLFFIPHAQLERAELIAVDRYIAYDQWESLVLEIREEWNQTLLLATIILAANCAFLAIPIFQDSTLVTHSSPEQIASYLSLISSLYGFVLALIFYRHYKTGKINTSCDLLTYILETSEEDVDNKRFEHLLVVWSLPHALIMWSALAFFLAFLFMCLLGTLTATKVVIGLSTSLLGFCSLYCIIKFGSGRELFRVWRKRVARDMKRLFQWLK